MLELPVESTKMSISDMTVSMATIWTPSKHACWAQNGSHSATNTRASEPTEDAYRHRRPEPTESESANLANIAVPAHQRALPAHDHTSYAHDAVQPYGNVKGNKRKCETVEGRDQSSDTKESMM